MTFTSYYWGNVNFDDPVLEAAREQLTSSPSSATRKRAFRALLESGETVAIGIALDRYHHSDAMARHGIDNEFSNCSADVLAQARELLRQPAFSSNDSAAEIDGANHASALAAMVNLAEPEDAELVARVLGAARNIAVRELAYLVAGACMQKSSEPPKSLLSFLAAVLFDESSSVDRRAEALKTLGRSQSPKVLDVVIQAARSEIFDLQVTAARILAYKDLPSYRPLIADLAATWPENPPYPASEVLDLLDEDDEDETEN